VTLALGFKSLVFSTIVFCFSTYSSIAYPCEDALQPYSIGQGAEYYLRWAEPKDLKGKYSAQNQILSALREKYGPRFKQDQKAALRRQIKRAVEKDELILICDGNNRSKVIGFFLYHHRSDEWTTVYRIAFWDRALSEQTLLLNEMLIASEAIAIRITTRHLEAPIREDLELVGLDFQKSFIIDDNDFMRGSFMVSENLRSLLPY